MIHPFALNIEKQFVGIKHTKQVPANCIHRIAFTDADCWLHQNFRIVKQDYDAPQAYFGLIEIKTTVQLTFTVNTIVPDLFWIYQKRGGTQIKKNDGSPPLILTAKEYVLAYSSPGEYEVKVEPGLHLVFIYVLNASWLLRYSKEHFSRFDELTQELRKRAVLCVSSRTLSIHAEIFRNILLLINLPELSKLSQDSNLYIPITDLVQMSHHDLKEERDTEKNKSSLMLINSIRTFIQQQLLQGSLPLLSKIAETYDKSTQYLTRIHKKHHHQTLERFIKDQKLAEAMRLLKTGLYTPTKVYKRLQYSSLSNFSNSFKEQFGISPQEVKTS